MAGDDDALGLVAVEPRQGERLVDVVHDALWQAIQAGRLTAGVKISESRIAESLGVSRTPVREALRRLQAAGMVVSRPHRGIVVVDPKQDAATVFAVRQRLEGLAASLAAQQMTVPQLERLTDLQDRMEALVDRMEAMSAEEEAEAREELAVLNARFHEEINSAAGSARLTQLIDQVSPVYLSREVVTRYSLAETRHSMEGHRAILDALWRRDSELADELVCEHLELGKRIVLRQLNAEPQDAASVVPALVDGAERAG